MPIGHADDRRRKVLRGAPARSAERRVTVMSANANRVPQAGVAAKCERNHVPVNALGIRAQRKGASTGRGAVHQDGGEERPRSP